MAANEPNVGDKLHFFLDNTAEEEEEFENALSEGRLLGPRASERISPSALYSGSDAARDETVESFLAILDDARIAEALRTMIERVASAKRIDRHLVLKMPWKEFIAAKQQGDVDKLETIAGSDLAAPAETDPEKPGSIVNCDPAAVATAIYLGDGKIRVGNDVVSVASSARNTRVLERLIEGPATYGDLESVLSSGVPSTIIKNLEKVRGGKLKPFIHRREKGQGYSTTIQDGRQKGGKKEGKKQGTSLA